ncbi:hypothetical protein THRCLA_02852 [Thraustotheca clavata]|uniref:Lipase-like C-terminal domain-containing protein n=1 Tax=Thraustotheca clavata TaxID=74557 RepID=A0A1W0A3U6_9STRA|nr:hypothetical protein THRCLA_02852 [Thraustotheca clavata]
MERTQQPVVLVHGAFGWGQNTPLFGTMPSYWPLKELDDINPNYIVVEVGKISSDYDRACEVFYQLYGGQVDYGEEHSTNCGHLRFGATYQPAHPNWGENNPVHLLGHSCGSTTAIELYQLLCKDHFGVGSNYKWIKSIICICGPLTGSTLSNLLGVGPDTQLKMLSGGHIIGSSFALFWKLQEFYLPSLKALYNLNMSQWTTVTSWADIFSPNSQLYASHDICTTSLSQKLILSLVWDDIVPAARLQKNQSLIDMDKVHLFSVVTSAKDHPNVLSGMTWFLSLFTKSMNKHEPFQGFDSRHWANNDGVVNTYSQIYPRVTCGRYTPSIPSYSPSVGTITPSSCTPDVESRIRCNSHISIDLEAHIADENTPIKGRWYTYHVEKNHFCGTYIDPDAKDLYLNLFKMVNKYSNATPEGAMGWGQKTPFFNCFPSYWPNELKKINPNHLVVDVGKASSDYDRACEVFYQLFGGTVDYGEEHSKSCGHLRYGETYPTALHSNWSENNPVHLLGHSCGATTAIELYQLLCKDAFGVGSNHKWVKSIVSICGPLTGSTLGNLLGGDATKFLDYGSSGYVIGTALTVLWKFQEFYMPWLKSVYDLRMPQWCNHTSWQWVFSNCNHMMISRDLAFYDILPSRRLSKNEELIEMDKVHLLSIATSATHHRHILFLLSYYLKQFTQKMEQHALYDGFESEKWQHNDGVVNTWSQRYPHLDSFDQTALDHVENGTMMKGQWYCKTLNDRNHLCGTHWDEKACDLYNDIFGQMIAWESETQ